MTKCIILAAGEGKRMHPLTYTRPKVMLPVANKPILEWNMINAKQAGIKDFIFIVNYKSEMVRNYFQEGKKWNVKIEYLNQGEPKGTAHAVGIAENFVDDFIVLCGDTIFGKNDIKNIISKNDSIGLFKTENPEDYGIVKTKNNKVEKIYEKTSQPFTNVINAGIYHFSKKVFDYIKRTKKSQRGEYEITDTINMMTKKHEFDAITVQQWQDVIYPWHLLDVNKEKLNSINKKVEGLIEENTTLKDKIVIGKNTEILNGSYIQGPVIIGNNCKIGPNCYIRPYTSIGDNCHIGNACEVKNSIIFNNTNVPHQNYVGDTIIGENCNLGAGCKIANLRLDKKNISAVINGVKINTNRRKLGVIMGDNVQTGINSMLNTGTIVGNNCFIGLGSIVKEEIEPDAKII